MGLHLAFTGIGLGLTMAPIAAAVINASPEEHRGTSSALVIIFRLVGMTIGVSGITTIGLRRMQILSTRLMPPDAGFEEISRIGTLVAEKVITDNFWIAAAVTALAILPAIFLRTRQANPEI
jgi:MFS family permease